MEPQRRASVLRFGHYELDLYSREVRKGGMRIRVQQQPLKLLEILLERPGEMVTREELRTRIWPNESFGDFDQAVNVAVTKLRAALQDSAENPQYVETLPKRGYRFIAPVAIVGGLSPDPTEASARNVSGGATHDAGRVAGMADAPPHLLSLRGWKIIAFALLVCLLVLAGWVWRSNRQPSFSIRSLAVLPLDNLSGDASQDYFADGMTDQLITDLAQISALRVISRTSVMSYKRARKPL